MSQENFITKALNDTVLSRRTFLKWSGALGGTAALAGGLNYGLRAADETAVQEGGQILTTSCVHNCGSRCILRAEVKDGTIVRLLPDQDFPDTFEKPRAIACLRGRSQRRRNYAPERLKYPMKRVGKRGEGKFERISWEEALDTVASELKRVIDTYGNEAVYYNYSSGVIAGGIDMCWFGGPVIRLLNLMGGFVNFYGSYSAACYGAVSRYITAASGNSADDLVNSKLIVLFAANPLVTRAGGQGQGYYLLKAKQAGAKFIVVDPRQTDTAVALDADWVPINPGTDVAFIAALAYVMIREDLYDKEFVATHTVGFDESNLPEGAPPNSSWMSYVLGDADGVAKTPEWAASITGIPAERIVQLARQIATTKPACLLQGLGWQRRAYGEQPVRALPVLAAMTGNIGVSGGGPGMRIGGGASVRMGGFPTGENPVPVAISCFMWPDYIERGSEMTSGPRDRIRGADKLGADMKFMWNYAGNTITNQHSDINATTKLLQDESKLEFIVVNDNMMTPSARFADILLPENSHMERENIITGSSGGAAFAAFSHKLVEQPFETRDVLWICEQIANRLDVGNEFRDGHNNREDWLRDMVAVARENDPNFPTYEEFKATGIYKVPNLEPRVTLAEFREDPTSNPLGTETGKVEIFSPHLYGQEDPEEIPAIPKYIPEWEGVSDPLREKYPLLLVTAHAVQRSHSTFDNVDWLEEAHPQALELNTVDAQERGIRNGNLVRIFNDRGEVVVPVRVTPRIRPGVACLPQGAWHTPDENGVDRRGSANVLTKYHPTPYAKGNPQHTNLVEVEKA